MGRLVEEPSTLYKGMYQMDGHLKMTVFPQARGYTMRDVRSSSNEINAGCGADERCLPMLRMAREIG